MQFGTKYIHCNYMILQDLYVYFWPSVTSKLSKRTCWECCFHHASNNLAQITIGKTLIQTVTKLWEYPVCISAWQANKLMCILQAQSSDVYNEWLYGEEHDTGEASNSTSQPTGNVIFIIYCKKIEILI